MLFLIVFIALCFGVVMRIVYELIGVSGELNSVSHNMNGFALRLVIETIMLGLMYVLCNGMLEFISWSDTKLLESQNLLGGN